MTVGFAFLPSSILVEVGRNLLCETVKPLLCYESDSDGSGQEVYYK